MRPVVLASLSASADLPTALMHAFEPLLLCLSAGFCVAYLVFIAQNLAPMTGYRGFWFVLGACPVVVSLALLRGVRALAPFSLVADVANILGALQQHVPAIPVCTLLVC